uniref:Uncharacterized protein n=1 Tax=Eutreptiella gymnastica TaxID=73025 RepID=A0A7S1N9F3_9EUGL|mmetsp:Transcript_142854/g.249160  ORF Transcript_142854/g.249160 Transcript_142854/m.249160 type:complete len:101 (+) Transcript_142854:2-304(+)
MLFLFAIGAPSPCTILQAGSSCLTKRLPYISSPGRGTPMLGQHVWHQRLSWTPPSDMLLHYGSCDHQPMPFPPPKLRGICKLGPPYTLCSFFLRPLPFHL